MLIHRFERPRRFVAGTVGAPGERTFFLQASDGGRVTSVALEKEQVLVLAERLEALLVEVGGGAGSGPAPERTVDLDPLDQPIEEEFRVGTMTLAWEPEAGEVVVEAFAATDVLLRSAVYFDPGSMRVTQNADGTITYGLDPLVMSAIYFQLVPPKGQ